MKNGLSRIGYFIIMIIILAIVKIISKELVKGTFDGKKQLTYDDSLKLYFNSFQKIEDSLNKFPVRVDEYTVMDSVRLSTQNNSINYFYSVEKFKKNEVDVDMLNNLLKPTIDSSVRNNVNMSINRRFKTKFYFNYFDGDGNFLTRIDAEY